MKQVKRKMDKKIEKASSLEKRPPNNNYFKMEVAQTLYKATNTIQLKGPTELWADHTMLTHQWRKIVSLIM